MARGHAHFLEPAERCGTRCPSCGSRRVFSRSIWAAAQRQNDFARHEQAQPGTGAQAPPLQTAVKPVKDFASLARRNRVAIAHDTHGNLILLARNRQCDGGAGRRILASVVQELTDGEPQEVRVRHHLARFALFHHGYAAAEAESLEYCSTVSAITEQTSISSSIQGFTSFALQAGGCESGAT